MNELQKIETIANVSDKATDKVKGILSWFNLPKEEARSHLIKFIKESDLPEDEMISLIFNSRKLARDTLILKKFMSKQNNILKIIPIKKFPMMIGYTFSSIKRKKYPIVICNIFGHSY